MLGDIIPEDGQWVKCRERSLGPGKVIQVNHNRGEFTALFLRSPEDGPEEVILPFRDVEEIIRNSRQIRSLEKELDAHPSAF